MTLLPRPVATCYLDLWTPIKARIETGGKERNGRQHKIHNLGRWEHTWGKTVFFLEQRYLWATWIFGGGPLKYIIQRSHMTDHHLYCEYVHWLKLTGWSNWPIRGRWVRSITQIKSDPTHLTSCHHPLVVNIWCCQRTSIDCHSHYWLRLRSPNLTGAMCAQWFDQWCGRRRNG